MNNHDAMDDMAAWAVANPMPRHEPQGRVEQSWPLRAGSPEWAVYEPDDEPKREAMSGFDALGLTVAILASCAFVAWLLRVIVGAVVGWLS